MPANKPAPALARMFFAHPASVDESYTQHARVALGFSGQLFLAAGAALVHALIPCVFEKTASRIIHNLHARMAQR